MKPKAKVELTHSILFCFLCGDRKDIEDLDSDLHHFIGHLRSWRDRGINLESDEETFNALEDVNEGVLVLDNAFSRLRELNSSRAFVRE